MLTPEIKDYIAQSRSSGISDLQTRQNLASQGWSQADLDEAFGVAPVAQTTPVATVPATSATSTTQTSNKSNVGKIILITLAILIILPLLFWVLTLVLNSKNNNSGAVIPKDTSPVTTNPPVSQQPTNSGQKLCGDWPSSEQDSNYLLGIKGASKLTSATTVNDMTIYPNASKMTEVNTSTNLHQVTACVKSASISDIVAYYQKISGYQVFEGSVGGPNLNFGSLKTVKIIQSTKGLLMIYDAGQGDVLLAYTYR